MKIDHLVINVDDKYQLDNNKIEEIERKVSHMNQNGEKELMGLKRQTYGLEMNTSK
jgi:hypothetical protein